MKSSVPGRTFGPRSELSAARVPRTLGCLLVGILAGLGCDRAPEGDPDRPNVLLVSIDTLRADHVGAYGAEGVATPTLDGLAREGTRFANAFSVSPLTLPSHASLLTGLYPTRHGVRHNGIYRLGSEPETLAERLRDAGYATGAIVGSFVLDAQFGLDRGFDTYDDGMMSRMSSETGSAERLAEQVSDQALAWLKDHRRGPFFLWVHYYDPHAIYWPPQEYAERFPDRPYDGEIAYVDAELGRLVHALQRDRRLDSTIVIVTSDHGESLGEHGEDTHSYGLYDATLEVPLVFRGPGVPAGQVVERVVSNVAVPATVLSMLRLDPPAASDGEDLSGLWSESAPAGSAPVYAETLATRIEYGWAPLFAMRSDEHLYISAPRPELYDVIRDPAQLDDLLAKDGGEDTTQVVSLLEDALEDVLRREDENRPQEQLDAETLRKLGALGYVLPTEKVQQTGMDPKDGREFLAEIAKAEEAQIQGDLQAAEKLFRDLAERHPESAKLQSDLALLYMNLGRFDRAREFAERAVAQVPQSSFYRALLGFACMELGEEERAVDAFRIVEQLDTSSPLAETGLMWVDAREGRMEDAEAHAQRAREFPSSSSPLEQIAKVWESVSQPERALRIYLDGLRINPGSEALHMQAAIPLTRLGRADEAQEHLSRAGRARRDPVLGNRLAIAYASTGDVKRAERILRAIVAQHPDYAPAQQSLAAIGSGTGAAKTD